MPVRRQKGRIIKTIASCFIHVAVLSAPYLFGELNTKSRKVESSYMSWNNKEVDGIKDGSHRRSSERRNLCPNCSGGQDRISETFVWN
ncbi:hypothetical protein FB451DRAFT_1203039 [Mycena latifolia]|nr:hypothetical protein FB451DRAFT_1203039 [Mycena latifolia]